jgi:hypothetical protein
MKNLVSMMMDFENGNLSEVDTVKMFSHLIKTRMAWSLQGFYGRTAHNLIESGVLDRKGAILIDLGEIYE